MSKPNYLTPETIAQNVLDSDIRNPYHQIVVGVEIQREQDAKIVESMISKQPPGRPRLVLGIAARAIRRGRFLTAREQLQNLINNLKEDNIANGDEHDVSGAVDYLQGLLDGTNQN
jgi:hypothetical protein